MTFLKGNVLNLTIFILDLIVYQTISSTMKMTVKGHRVIQAGRDLRKCLVQPLPDCRLT